MKTKSNLKILTSLLCVGLISVGLNAATMIGTVGTQGTAVVSTGGTQTGISGQLWTNGITGAYTNLILLNSYTTKDTALQFQVTCMTTNGTATNVIWQLARSVSGGSSTNLNGSPMILDLFAQVTNTIPINSTVSPPVIFNLTQLPPSASPPNVLVQSTFNDGAITAIYAYSITATNLTLTNGTTVYINSY